MRTERAIAKDDTNEEHVSHLSDHRSSLLRWLTGYQADCKNSWDKVSNELEVINQMLTSGQLDDEQKEYFAKIVALYATNFQQVSYDVEETASSYCSTIEKPTDLNKWTYKHLLKFSHSELELRYRAKILNIDFCISRYFDEAEIGKAVFSQTSINFICEHTFAGLNSMYVINLSQCHLKQLNGCLSKATTLTHIDLYSNDLKEITNEHFKGLTNLDVLRLSSNKITTIESEAFVDLHKLSLLTLNENKLSTIPAMPNNLN